MDDYLIGVLSNIGVISFLALSAYLLLLTGEISFGLRPESSRDFRMLLDYWDQDKLKLSAGVDESEIGKIRPGMEVIFNVDAYGRQGPLCRPFRLVLAPQRNRCNPMFTAEGGFLA